MGILSRWRLVLQRWSLQSRKFVVVFYIRRQITITPECRRQYGRSRTKNSIDRNTVGDGCKSARWLAGEESGRKTMRWAVENVCFLFFVMKKKSSNAWSIRVLQEELVKLGQLSKEWIGRKVADYEDEKSRIAEIFERVNEARIQFGVSAASLCIWYSNRPLCLAWHRSPNLQGRTRDWGGPQSA